jgi:hypothetical protein
MLATWIEKLGLPLLSEDKRRTLPGGFSKDNPEKIPSPSPPPQTIPEESSDKSSPEPQRKKDQLIPVVVVPKIVMKKTLVETKTIPSKTRKNNSLADSVKTDIDLASQARTTTKEKLKTPQDRSHGRTLLGWTGFADFLHKNNLCNDSSSHIPSSEKIPTSSKKDILDGWKLSENFIKGDGNCLFRGVATWLLGHQDQHQKIRTPCYDELAKNQDHYAPFVTRDDLRQPGQTAQEGLLIQSLPEEEIYNFFLRKSQSDGFWGGDHHLSAVSHVFGIQLVVLSQNGGTYAFQPRTGELKRTIYLWYNGNNHYEIIWNPQLHSAQSANLVFQTPQRNTLPGKSVLKPSSFPRNPADKSSTTILSNPQAKNNKRVSFGTLVHEKIITTGNSLLHIDPRLQTPPSQLTKCSSTISNIRKSQHFNSAPPQPRNLVVVIPPISSFPWNQPLPPNLKRKRNRIAGLEKNHGLPIINGYWNRVNERLKLETGKNKKTIPYGVIRFAMPEGLLEGWYISHNLIQTSKSIMDPDITGFYHAVNYWMSGTQDRHSIFQKDLAEHLGKQLPQMSKNSSRLVRVDNKKPFSVDEIKKAFHLVSDGKKPDQVIYSTAATMLRVVLVVVEMGPTSATWSQYSPFGSHNLAPFPSIYLFFNLNVNRFQIMWAPQIHQPVVCPENPELETRLLGNTNLLSNPQSQPSHDHTFSVQPSENKTVADPNPDSLPPQKRFKTQPTSQIPHHSLEPNCMPTIEDLRMVDFGPALTRLHIYHHKDTCNRKCCSISQAAYFELGDFRYVGWRLSIGFFPDDQNSIWRVLSLWIYKSQERYNEVRKLCDDRPCLDLEDNPPEFHSSEIPRILKIASTRYRANILLLHIQDGYGALEKFEPCHIDEHQQPSTPRYYFIYSWKGRFGILYCQHHL